MSGKLRLVSLAAALCGGALMASVVGSSAQGYPQETPKAEQHQGVEMQKMHVPASLRAEHEELHKALFAATELGGRTGPAAEEVAALLHPHFVREEQFALPPLSRLKEAALGKTPKDDRAILAMTDKLREEYDRMVGEHREIVGALDRLAIAARKEKHPDVVEFAEKLKLHAQNEEEVLYPAAMVLGEYLKLKAKA